MAGGGSTVRGVPQTRSIDPFVASGEKGTLVLMADGSVRFVSKNISPEAFEAFQALCTIQGKVTLKEDEWNRQFPLVPPPRQGGMKAQDKPPEKASTPGK
jgi:hypothetical protein